ncbi:hypothetical protein DB346_13165 [Verrucomicrobia bacterium LW23]|nr:hypothetical protein DB346_13165 [Verrucomicrobia bacterium LW23]
MIMKNTSFDRLPFIKPFLVMFVAALMAAGCTAVFLGTPLFAETPVKPIVDASPLAQAAQPTFSFKSVVSKVAPSVVNIYTDKTSRVNRGMAPYLDDPALRHFFDLPFESVPRERKEQSLGSGVIVTPDGYILTNNHVIDGADKIQVALQNSSVTYEAKLIGSDPQTDIAVIKVEAKDLPSITLADSDLVEVGDVVLAIGNPFGVGQTVTMGIVSGKGRSGMGIVDYEDFIQTDASINPGNSGGALVDAAGRLVGINQSILSRTGGNQGVGFSVPVNLARYVMERLVADGKVTRGYLGVVIQPVTPELAKEFKLSGTSGALVSEVSRKSPAGEAGVKPGDVIVEYNGRKVADSRQLRLMVAQTVPGTQVNLKLMRDGREEAVTLKLEELRDGKTARSRTDMDSRDLLDGAAIDDLTPDARQQFRIPDFVESGVVVTRVEPRSTAALAGLSRGDVILEINRRQVSSTREAMEFSRNLGQGERLLLHVWGRGGTRFVVISGK